MNTKKSIISIFIIVLTLIMTSSAILYAQDKDRDSGKDNKKTKKEENDQQKITTPPLKLSEEEETRTPRKEGKEKPKSPGMEYSPTELKTKTQMELILDASGSMNGILGTSTKMDILKSAVKEVLSAPLPKQVKRNVGLRVYGTKSTSEENNCKDSVLLQAIQKIDTKKFKELVNDIKANGVTPIGYALKEAFKDFKEEKNVDNVIILVTDGADSCEVNVCEIASDLHAGSKNIIIHVIAFDVDQKTAKEINCIAQNTDGLFIQARSENELVSALEQTLMANVPYNLKVKIVSGATPLPSTLVVYRKGTKKVVREDKTSGIKFYQLPPGTYDIEVIYSGSKEQPLPSKLIRNVEVQATSKAEQIVQFDLGMLTLKALDQDGNPTSAVFTLKNIGDPKIQAKLKSGPGPVTIWLTEGKYKVEAESTTPSGLKFEAIADSVEVTKEKGTSHEFTFQVGTIKVNAVSSAENPVPINYSVTKAGEDKKVIMKGEAKKGEVELKLPPGKYDLYLSLALQNFEGLNVTKLENIEVSGGDTITKEVEIPTATLTLAGKDSENNFVQTEFLIKQAGRKEVQAEITSENEPVAITLPPGAYDIKAVFLGSDLKPKPTIAWNDIRFEKGQEVEKIAVFRFGILKLFGRTSKGAPVNTAFYVYRTGEEEPIATLIGITNWTSVRLTEGFYDIKSVDISSPSEPNPTIWFHNIQVQSESPSAEEAIFTHGKLKMHCQGPNNVPLDCIYKVFSYGTDSPLFEGSTDKQWKEYDIPPGFYYIEAGYHDPERQVLMQKWISIEIEENEMLDQVIRF